MFRRQNTNSYIQDKWFWLEARNAMRMEIIGSLSNADLTFTPGGANITLGALLRETGDIEQSYLQSLKDFKQTFTNRSTDPALESSVAAIKTWYQQMDEELKTVISAFSDDDFKKPVKRESGYEANVEYQLEFYLQCLFIFFGKVVIYLKAMDKPLTSSVRDYIW